MRPSALPKLRDQVLRHLDDPAAPLRSRTGEHNQAALDAEASRLRDADLYWVAPDMAALAVSAGVQLAAARWATADRPTPCGLIMFDGGIGSVDYNGAQVPVEAITWGPADGGCSIGLWLTRATLADRISRFATLVEDQVPPLIPVVSHILPVTVDPLPLASLPVDIPVQVVSALAAAWLLMEQPSLAERRPERPDKATARAYARASRAVPEVSIIDLRRAYVPDAQEETGEDAAGRRYRHRWVVQGHWRNAWRPSVKAHRQVWIPAHVKGPSGAPFLKTEKVNVWRR
ncbi:hypothetical protein [Kitasatospora sp. GP82]|uniref:hypothetical protein n=1 Tax=Kitasatospora sp. GP82 TaxID=3035089 RepID=UPI00247396C3|nr:hypothetical protein [Kitasatospora sp. GP82]MDH6130352.1 hypothetical protein [Kitasatospora sp. GP82]